jgi:hypothetical protein
MVKKMFGRDLDSGRTTLVDYIDGHDAATVIVKKPAKGSQHSAASWRVWSRHREPRNRLFFQYLHDSPLPNQTDKYVEDGGGRSFTVTAEGNKGWWAHLTKGQNSYGFKIPTGLRFKIAEPDGGA